MILKVLQPKPLYGSMTRRAGHGYNTDISGSFECYNGLLETVNEAFN